MFELAKKAYYRSQHDQQESLNGILLSALAFECFMNEFEDIAQDCIGQKDLHRLQTLRDIIADLEKGNAHLRIKIQAIHYFLTLRKLSFGRAPYQDLSILIDIRNTLVHRKPEKFEWDIDNPEKEYDPHRFVKFLADRQVIKRPPKMHPGTWSLYVIRSEVAKWAYDTAVAVIKDIAIVIPASRFARRIHFLVRFFTEPLSKIE
jgi:hypothetical protein